MVRWLASARGGCKQPAEQDRAIVAPPRWRGKREVTEPEPYPGTTASFPDLQATQTMQADSGLLADWTQTAPQQPAEPGSQSPPSTSQAPWGPAEYS